MSPTRRLLLRGLSALLLLLAMAALVMLGFWQLDRARHKQAMIDAVARVLDRRDPVSVAQALDGDDNGFAWSLVSGRSEEHTSELQSLMRISYAVFCLKKKT